MNGNGLDKSIWAQSGGGKYSLKARDNWVCLACGFSNFEWRKACFRCSAAKGAARLEDNIPPRPTAMVYPNGQKTPDISVRTDQQAQQAIPHVAGLDDGNGLATSRWAPRNQRGTKDTEQIWTRTVYKNAEGMGTGSGGAARPTDLGLPYEVQHYILAMMERILEEACYDFAARWAPELLREKGWDCPEAVELSTWKSVLVPAGVLPGDALQFVPNTTLERALGDAVRIRNAAVHRHLCDNKEMRRMAGQARDLMAMFGDGTRAEKFSRLVVELVDWDAGRDLVVAKGRLLEALREVSERPVDDMDWTPNSVSLREVTDVALPAEESDYHGDEMDID